MGFREALQITIKRYRVNQAKLSRRTKVLADLGQGEFVDRYRLNNFLQAKTDLHGEAVATLIHCLNQDAKANVYLLLATTPVPDWQD